ncbi:hypothetical protein HY480_01685 [Candidatus Uhrbacteria bacterium]|nr:hypothetical protein [Candidatus Uhrbacteria bacterium]
MPVLTAALAIVSGIAVAIIGRSALPWLPVLRTIAPVAALLSALAPVAVRSWHLPVLAIVTAAAGSAALMGAPLLPAIVTMGGAWALLKGARLTLRQGTPVIALITIAVVGAFAERVVVPILSGTFPPISGVLVVARATLAAAVWNGIFVFIALRFTQPRHIGR